MSKRRAEREFLWVHEMGGRGHAAEYLLSHGFEQSGDVKDPKKNLMQKLCRWTASGRMSASAFDLLIKKRGVLSSADMKVMTYDQYADQRRKRAA